MGVASTDFIARPTAAAFGLSADRMGTSFVISPHQNARSQGRDLTPAPSPAQRNFSDAAGDELAREIADPLALPETHSAVKTADAAWAAAAKKGFSAASDLGYPVPPCPPCTDDPWVVLATIRIPVIPQTGTGTGTKPPITQQDITFLDRRVLYSTTALQVLIESGI
jgi:hypothetical protein